MDKLKFEKIRKELVKEYYERSDKEQVSVEFRMNFFKLIEFCSFSLMEEKENFFAHFLIQLKRELLMDLATATASKITGSSYTIYFNPVIFLDCSFEEMKALLKHEVYHIISLHHVRARSLLKMYSPRAVNTAMDIAVNQYILNLPLWCEKIEDVALSYNIMLNEESTVEEYARLIQEAMDRKKEDRKSENINDSTSSKDRGGNSSEDVLRHDIEKAHDIWEYCDYDMEDTQIKEITKKLVNSSIRGEIPESIEKMISAFNTNSELDWVKYLMRLVGTIPNGSKKTVTRRDRRQPERLDIRGRLSKNIIDIVVAIDISGSMSDAEMQKIMLEVVSIVKNFKHKLSVIECDNEIRRVYEVRKVKDIRQKLNTRGGTKFTPVFEYINKKFSKDTLLIYFTDGIGEKELSIANAHKRVMWVLTGKEDRISLSNAPGVIKKLTSNKKVQQDMLALEYLKNELKDIRSEWAK
jgi:predicted metal-dependent peptidase